VEEMTMTTATETTTVPCYCGGGGNVGGGGENASIGGFSHHGVGNLSKWSVVSFLQDEICSIDEVTGADWLDWWSKGVLCVCLGLMGLMVGPLREELQADKLCV
jgi:hypothetical protein